VLGFEPMTYMDPKASVQHPLHHSAPLIVIMASNSLGVPWVFDGFRVFEVGLVDSRRFPPWRMCVLDGLECLSLDLQSVKICFR